MTYSWSQPICNGCWEEQNPGRSPTRLASHVTEGETCCLCGTETFSGIYVRVDPSTVAFPTREKA